MTVVAEELSRIAAAPAPNVIPASLLPEKREISAPTFPPASVSRFLDISCIPVRSAPNPDKSKNTFSK
jgi:hypothetical protein